MSFNIILSIYLFMVLNQFDSINFALESENNMQSIFDSYCMPHTPSVFSPTQPQPISRPSAFINNWFPNAVCRTCDLTTDTFTPRTSWVTLQPASMQINKLRTRQYSITLNSEHYPCNSDQLSQSIRAYCINRC